jgi:excisionase family DNA binding protein
MECVMENERDHGSGSGCAVAVAIRELAAAVRATVPEPLPDPDALLTAEEVGELLQLSPRTLKDQAAVGVLPHPRFGKHYRFTRGDVAEIVRLSATPVKPQRRRVPLAELAEDFRAACALQTSRWDLGEQVRLPHREGSRGLGAGTGSPDPAQPVAGPA